MLERSGELVPSFFVALSKNARLIIIVLGGMFAFIIAVVGGGAWWLSANKDRLLGDLKTKFENIAQEAEEFGKTHDQQDCLDEYDRRMSKCKFSVTCVGAAAGFTGACLELAQPTPGFCDDVPNENEEPFKASTWPTTRCIKDGKAGDSTCSGKYDMLVSYCTDRN